MAEFSLTPWGGDLASIFGSRKVPQSPEEVAQLLYQAGRREEDREREVARRQGRKQ